VRRRRRGCRLPLPAAAAGFCWWAHCGSPACVLWFPVLLQQHSWCRRCSVVAAQPLHLHHLQVALCDGEGVWV
jgi:hypothetical protein